MSIFPLPQFEADMAEADRQAYERLKPPTSIVVRFGRMRMVGEFPYSGDAKPGCGSKLVVRTHRGVELAEMLTSTCPNAGCSKSVTRKQMLEYIENSGGADYPFHTEGRVLRIAAIEDLNEQSRLEASIPALVRDARAKADALNLPMRIVDAEPILGGERLTFYFTADDRVDFRELVHELARERQTRIELRQVGARDEARLTADYERCGQHCCCKQFLKVLKPVSMRSAKVQKATLDPLKISGRCGRLMCCLRYEDETYESLRKRLPRMKSRVGTPEGPGIVIDSQILTQLVLVRLEHEDRNVAVPVENLSEPPPPGAPPPPKPGPAAAPAAEDPLRGMSAADIERRTGPSERRAPRAERQDAYRERSTREPAPDQPADRAPRADMPPAPDADAPTQQPPQPPQQSTKPPAQTGDKPPDAEGNQQQRPPRREGERRRRDDDGRPRDDRNRRGRGRDDRAGGGFR